MTKQVHIHIHRTKARDAGEGEGKWITLSPSGTHVKVDGKGEITAGPKGMAGKKPSELASGPKQGEVGHSEHQKYGAYFKKGEQVRGPGGKVHEVFSHVGPAVETSGGRFHPTKVSKVAPTSVNQKAAAEMRTASAPDPIKQARQFEEQASKLHQQAQAEYQKNGPSDEHARLKREAQKATNQGTDLMAQAEAAARTSKPGPDGKPMGIHPALAAVTPPGFPTPGSQEGNKVRVNQATGELSMVGSSGKAQAKTESYSWGKLTKVGNVNESAIAHPQDRKSIATLQEGESYNYTDEQGKKWQVTRRGDQAEFSKPGEKQPSLVAPMREFQDSQAGPATPKLTESDLGKAASEHESQAPGHLEKNPLRSHYHKQAASRFSKASELLVEARKAWARGSEKQYHELQAEAKRLHASGLKNAEMALTAAPTKGMDPKVPSHRGEYPVPASIKRNS